MSDDEMRMPDAVLLNPEAVGNPNETPIVFVGADLRALLNPCECGGVNGFHKDYCQPCCDLHGRTCESPGELCCWNCPVAIEGASR